MRKLLSLQALLIGAVLFLFGIGPCLSCVGTVGHTISPDTLESQEPLFPSVAMVTNEQYLATAWPVTDKLLFTAGHFCAHHIAMVAVGDVEDTALKIVLVKSNGMHGKAISTKIVAVLEEPDICLLETVDHGMPPLELGSPNQLVAGDLLVVAGCPQVGPFAQTYGTVMAFEEPTLLMNLWVEPGNSGSPVLHDGQVVGMVIGYYPEARMVSYAVSGNMLSLFLILNII